MADESPNNTIKLIVAVLGALAAIVPVGMNYANSSNAGAPSSAPTPALSTPAESPFLTASPTSGVPVPTRAGVVTSDAVTLQTSEVRRGGTLPGEPTSGITSPLSGHVRLFGEARAFARGLRLLSHAEWDLYAASAAKPADIPAEPATEYRDHGWVSWNDWLGIK